MYVRVGSLGNKLTLNEHVSKAAHYHVRALRHVRQYVSKEIATPIATSSVGVRLDYCKSVYYGIARNISY